MKRPNMSKIPFSEIVHRIRGVDTPIGGISWEPPVSDVHIAKIVLTILEDKRALYNPYHLETGEYVVQSILGIREKLTNLIPQLNRTAPLAKSLIAIRVACREFLDKAEELNVNFIKPDRYGRYKRGPYGPAWGEDARLFFMALGELRRDVGFHAARIAVMYGIDVEEPLVAIFPVPSDE